MDLNEADVPGMTPWDENRAHIIIVPKGVKIKDLDKQMANGEIRHAPIEVKKLFSWRLNGPDRNKKDRLRASSNPGPDIGRKGRSKL